MYCSLVDSDNLMSAWEWQGAIEISPCMGSYRNNFPAAAWENGSTEQNWLWSMDLSRQDRSSGSKVEGNKTDNVQFWCLSF